MLVTCKTRVFPKHHFSVGLFLCSPDTLICLYIWWIILLSRYFWYFCGLRLRFVFWNFGIIEKLRNAKLLSITMCNLLMRTRFLKNIKYIIFKYYRSAFPSTAEAEAVVRRFYLLIYLFVYLNLY